MNLNFEISNLLFAAQKSFPGPDRASIPERSTEAMLSRNRGPLSEPGAGLCYATHLFVCRISQNCYIRDFDESDIANAFFKKYSINVVDISQESRKFAKLSAKNRHPFIVCKFYHMLACWARSRVGTTTRACVPARGCAARVSTFAKGSRRDFWYRCTGISTPFFAF